MPVHLRLGHETAEQVGLDIVGVQIVQRSHCGRECAQPDRVQGCDIERGVARLEFGGDPVVETGIRKFDQSDLGARLLLVEVGDRLELGLSSALNDNREGVVPRGRAAAAAGAAGAQHQGANCQRRDTDALLASCAA